MKKSFAVILCVSILCVCALSACGKKNAAATASPAEVSVVPETDNAPVTGETKEFSIEINGEKQVVPMTYTQFDLSELGGPTVSLYVDDATYDIYPFGGEYDIVPKTDPDDAVSRIHLSFMKNTTAEDAAKARLTDGAPGATVADNGTVHLDNCDAPSVLLTATDYTETIYYVNSGKGAVCISVFAFKSSDAGLAARLNVTAKTILVNS